MKIFIGPGTLLVALSLGFQHCSKKNDAQSEPVGVTQVIVLEKGTLQPVSGATVDLLRCIASNPLFGCIMYDPTPVQSVKTDAKGRAQFSSSIKGYGVKTRHPNYWDKLKEDGSGEVLLSPYAWVNVQVKRTGNYNPGSTVNLSAVRDCNDCGVDKFVLNYYEDIGLPADTTITFPVEATESTTVSWFVKDPVSSVNDKSGAAQPFRLNKDETKKITFIY